MKIQILRNESDILREYPYGSRPVENNAGISNKRRENGNNRGGIARDTVYGNKLALPHNGSAGPDKQKAIVPIKSSLIKKDNDVIFLNKMINPKDTSNSDQTPFFLNTSTEFVKDQYEIGKIALDIPRQRISKYREAQAYRLLQEPILEIFI
jgi:hypothetical protein